MGFLISLSFPKMNGPAARAARNRVGVTSRRTQTFFDKGFDNCMAMKMVVKKLDGDIMVISKNFVSGLSCRGESDPAGPPGPGQIGILHEGPGPSVLDPAPGFSGQG